MNKFWRRTQSHKTNNTAGKHFARLRSGNGAVMVIIIVCMLGACWKVNASYSTPHFEYGEKR